MAQLGDAIVPYPLSGSTTPANVYLRNVQQVMSATMYVLMHPGGSMTGSLQLAPSNLGRGRFTLMNSGSLAMAIEHGTQNFNPNAPLTPTNNYDNIVLGTIVLQGNQGVQPSVDFIESAPCYTGPIRIGWIGSGTLSGSAVAMVEYTLSPNS